MLSTIVLSPLEKEKRETHTELLFSLSSFLSVAINPPLVDDRAQDLEKSINCRSCLLKLLSLLTNEKIP